MEAWMENKLDEDENELQCCGFRKLVSRFSKVIFLVGNV